MPKLSFPESSAVLKVHWETLSAFTSTRSLVPFPSLPCAQKERFSDPGHLGWCFPNWTTRHSKKHLTSRVLQKSVSSTSIAEEVLP